MALPQHPYLINQRTSGSGARKQFSTPDLSALLDTETFAHQQTRQQLFAEHQQRIVIENERQQDRERIDQLQLYVKQILDANAHLRGQVRHLLCLSHNRNEVSPLALHRESLLTEPKDGVAADSAFRLDPIAPKIQQIKALRRHLALDKVRDEAMEAELHLDTSDDMSDLVI